MRESVLRWYHREYDIRTYRTHIFSAITHSFICSFAHSFILTFCRFHTHEFWLGPCIGSGACDCVCCVARAVLSVWSFIWPIRTIYRIFASVCELMSTQHTFAYKYTAVWYYWHTQINIYTWKWSSLFRMIFSRHKWETENVFSILSAHNHSIIHLSLQLGLYWFRMANVRNIEPKPREKHM